MMRRFFSQLKFKDYAIAGLVIIVLLTANRLLQEVPLPEFEYPIEYLQSSFSGKMTGKVRDGRDYFIRFQERADFPVAGECFRPFTHLQNGDSIVKLSGDTCFMVFRNYSDGWKNISDSIYQLQSRGIYDELIFK